MMVHVLKRPIDNDGETLMNSSFKLENSIFNLLEKKINHVAGAQMMTVAC